MPIPCTAKFTTTEALPARAVSSQVYLVLGNYCTAAGVTTSSSGDFSADYPSAGVIDGDRTELNAGPATGAENNIGKSTWRSSTVPDTTDTWLVVDFGTPRTINRIKLYQAVGHVITFRFQYWDGAAWQDIFPVSSTGYGDYPFGDTPFGDPFTWATTNDFSDLTTTKIKVTIDSTLPSLDYANIVEIEAYRLVDISERVTSWQTNRNRDFKLRQDMASSASLSCDNSDKYFSPDYVPTAAQISEGFVNSELRSQLGVIVKAGFEWSGSQRELLAQFTGTVDKIEVNSKSRIATIEARDGMKSLFSPLINSTLKTGISLEAAILYTLNLRNISVWDTDLDESKLTLSYFFATGADAKSVIDEIVIASGDAQFYFDENGIATYRQYSTLIPNNFVYYQKISTQPSQPDWNSYTSIDNISLDRQPDQVTIGWPNIDGWADGDYTVNPIWTTRDNGTHLIISGGKLTSPATGDNRFRYVCLPFNFISGQVEFLIDLADTPSGTSPYVVFNWQTDIPPAWAGPVGQNVVNDGYTLNISMSLGNTHITFTKIVGFVIYTLGSYTISGTTPISKWIKVNRTSLGAWNVYYNGIKIMTFTDTTYMSLTYLVCGGTLNITGASGCWKLSNIFYSSESVDTTNIFDHTTNTPTWISDTLDLGADIISFGTLEAVVFSETNCTPNLYVQTSADGLSFPDGWIAVNPNAQITSTPRRYAQVKMEYSSMNYNFGVFPTPSLNSMVINWNRSGGTNKYPLVSSRAIAYDGSLLDVTQTTTDTLGGDNSILNDVLVIGQPYNLTGTDADIAWEYLTGIPAEVVSVTNPLFLNTGTHIFKANIPSGMDTSRMTGTNPACLNIAYVTALGSAVITFKSPVNPVIELTIITAGTISAFQLLGKIFSTQVRNFSAEAKDATSIKLYDLKSDSITNPFIINSGIATQIADTRLANYKDETKVLDNVSTTLQPSSQLSDRVTVTDLNTAISADYWVVGVQHYYSSSQIYTIYKLWKIP